MRFSWSTTSSFEIKSFASEDTCRNNTSGMSYSPHTIFARTCSIAHSEAKVKRNHEQCTTFCGIGKTLALVLVLSAG